MGLWSDQRALVLWAKPGPALILALLASGGGDRYAGRVAAGLLVSSAADLAIEWSFLAGLALFLVAHLLYAAAFTGDAPGLRLRAAWPFAVFGLGAYAVLAPGAAGMRVPLAAYVLVITTMMWRAAARRGATSRGPRSEGAALAGALLFAASDTLIGLDRFVTPLAGVRPVILLLYWTGQLGIAVSAAPPRETTR